MRIGLDLDGTLITCGPKHCNLMKAITKAFNLDFDESKYWEDKNSGLNNKSALMKQGISCSFSDKVSDIWIKSIENIEWASFDKLLSETISALTTLKKKGHTLHLVSARNNIPNAKLQLKLLGIDRLFESIDFVSINSKKSKSYYFKARNIECYFGDTEADFKESKLACIDFYPVLTGMRNNKFFVGLDLKNEISLNLEQAINQIPTTEH